MFFFNSILLQILSLNRDKAKSLPSFSSRSLTIKINEIHLYVKTWINLEKMGSGNSRLLRLNFEQCNLNKF